MCWEVRSVVDMRMEMCRAVLVNGVTITEATAVFGVSRPTVYKWLGRFQASGKPGLEGRSRQPHRSPNRVAEWLEEKVVEERKQHSAWGGRKIARVLLNEGTVAPHSRTVDRILRRHALTSPRVSAQEVIRFERGHSNDLWQFDFKRAVRLRGGCSVYPFTVLDDHSRFLLALVACADHQMETGWAVYWDALGTHGMPLEALSDNARAFRTIDGLSQWTSRLLRLGILHTSGRPRHPQTQGKVERFHGTLQRELLSHYKFPDIATLQRALDDFRCEYNHIRPHEALELEVPASCYEHSQRERPERIPDVLYPAGSEVRRIDTHGDVSYRGTKIWIGAGVRGERVRLVEQDGDVVLDYAGHEVRRVPKSEIVSGRRL